MRALSGGQFRLGLTHGTMCVGGGRELGGGGGGGAERESRDMLCVCQPGTERHATDYFTSSFPRKVLVPCISIVMYTTQL